LYSKCQRSSFPDGDQDARRFARFQDDDDLIGLRATEVRVNEPVASLLGWGLDKGDTPLDGARGHPVLVPSRDVAEHRFTHGVQLGYALKNPTTRSGC
jgi:hypothetical protein